MATHRHPEFASEINVRRPHGRIFLRTVFRYLGLLLAIAGVAALAYDAVAANFSVPQTYRSTMEWWDKIHAQSLRDFGAFCGQALWDGAVKPALLLPAFAIPIVLGPILMFMGRRRY